mmetsp:Transcript_38626/g.84119  ORF Transcript_38626/g.84119 Transcript_38626/m.84119 type:complete len:264 (+) Transcript_38626:100-891(+)
MAPERTPAIFGPVGSGAARTRSSLQDKGPAEMQGPRIACGEGPLGAAGIGLEALRRGPDVGPSPVGAAEATAEATEATAPASDDEDNGEVREELQQGQLGEVVLRSVLPFLEASEGRDPFYDPGELLAMESAYLPVLSSPSWQVSGAVDADGEFHDHDCSSGDSLAEAPLCSRAWATSAMPTKAPAGQQLYLLGSPQLPTLGSEGHFLGMCKPCAFVFKGGCNNGIECEFCHLCQPGEKKRRKKVSRQAMRQDRQAGLVHIAQ